MIRFIQEEDLVPTEALKFIDQAFKTGEIKESGTAIVKVIKPVSMFGKNNSGVSRSQKKQSVLDRLIDFFNRFFPSVIRNIEDAVDLIEQTLKQFKSGEAISDSRKLLQVSFKETLDSNIT